MYGQWRTACLGAAHSVKMGVFFVASRSWPEVL